MAKLFGTDGIRGVVGVGLTADLAERVGRSTSAIVGTPGRAPVVLICRDTRPSGIMLEEALSSGIVSAGGDAVLCGILPTPAIAFLVVNEGADAGAVISASHNPPDYNGIKFFGPAGYKLSDAQEDEIETRLDGSAAQHRGFLRKLDDAEDKYVRDVLRALDGRTLEGIKVVADCGFGAAFRTTPRALREAGADVIALNDEPDGARINVGCGSTNPEAVAKAVVENSADAGLAHDGDADRVIAVDEKGNIVDGDAMLAALAIELKEQERLPGDLVIATVMANLGFRRAMSSNGIEIIETPVGDRHVSEALLRHNAGVGGEQSGHLIFAEYSTTGDGLITSLRLLARMSETGQSLSELAGVVTRFPQVLLNVAVTEPGRVGDAEKVWKAVSRAQNHLGDSGRVMVRPSGTEPVVRVMVEASDEPKARDVAEEIAGVIEQELGGDAAKQPNRP